MSNDKLTSAHLRKLHKVKVIHFMRKMTGLMDFFGKIKNYERRARKKNLR